MEDTLVTVAIHTYEKAQILKSVLEIHGIDVFIHSVNPILPVFPMGVRVKIRQSDLTKALSIIEDMQSTESVNKALNEMNQRPMVLLPIDFSNYSLKTCEFGFQIAASLQAEVVLMHAYSVPSFRTMPISDVINYESKHEEETERLVEEDAKASLTEIEKELEAKMERGDLPRVEFRHVLRKGVPEDQILGYAERHNPLVIVMGTRGSNQKDADLIGSVTAEVIERSFVPVIAIPENVQYNSLSEVKNIAYSTNFDDADLFAFERMIQLMAGCKFKIHFIHFDSHDDNWAEIKLSGIKEYFSKNYPELETDYTLLSGKDIESAYDQFIHENNIDLFSLTTHKRSLFARLFNPSMAKKMAFHMDTPMLVFHA